MRSLKIKKKCSFGKDNTYENALRNNRIMITMSKIILGFTSLEKTEKRGILKHHTAQTASYLLSRKKISRGKDLSGFSLKKLSSSYACTKIDTEEG